MSATSTDRTVQPDWEDECIQYEGRDENGDKRYSVVYGDKDVGTFQTYDEAYAALCEYVAKLNP